MCHRENRIDQKPNRLKSDTTVKDGIGGELTFFYQKNLKSIFNLIVNFFTQKIVVGLFVIAFYYELYF